MKAHVLAVAAMMLAFAPNAEPALSPSLAVVHRPIAASTRRSLVHMQSDPRSRRLNKQAFNRRNMAVDERQAYDALMEQRASAARRNAFIGLAAAAAAAAAFFFWSQPAEAVAVALPNALLLADEATSVDDGKVKGRLIFGVIVANSIFWQYLLPLVKGQPTSTGRKKK